MDRKTIPVPGYPGFVFSGVTDEDERVVKGRDAFATKYCAEKGWDREKLTIPQILEIRKEEGWKNPT